MNYGRTRKPKVVTPTVKAAVDQDALEKVVRDNLTPEGVAATVAFLRVAGSHYPSTEAGKDALQQVAWLADKLQRMIGVKEYNRLLDEIGL